MVFIIIVIQNGILLLLVESGKSVWRIGTEAYMEISSNEKSLISFDFPLEEFEKMRITRNEFIYEGSLYDIKNAIIIGQCISITAKQDYVELLIEKCSKKLKDLLTTESEDGLRDFFVKKKFDWKFLNIDIELMYMNNIHFKKIFHLIDLNGMYFVQKYYPPPNKILV